MLETNVQAINKPDIVSTGSISNPRQIIPFDADWRFWLGDNQEAKKPGFDDKSWRTLDLPHDWSIESPINPPPDGVAIGGFFAHWNWLV